MDFISRAEFRQWLKSLPPDDRLTEDWSHCTCPLALALKAKGSRDPYVRPDRRTKASRWHGDWKGQSGEGSLPTWANAFGLKIDAVAQTRSLAQGLFIFAAVTPRDCLGILSSIPRS